MRGVFITGAAGFIGSYTAEEFINRNWHVTALIHKRDSARLTRLKETGHISPVKGDITNFDSLNNILMSVKDNIDVIVHCAGRASDVGWKREFRQTNLDSVKHLVKLTKSLNIRRFVFVSSTDVYGLRDFNGQAEDELPLKAYPRNPYPEFKILAEDFIRKELPAEQFSILRPAQVWGVGDTTLTTRIVDFLRWSPWIIHFGRWKGKNRWPLAHVRNVATAAYLAAVTPESAGRAINVVDNEQTSIDEFYRILAGIYFPQKKLKTIILPFWSGFALGAAVSGISNLFNLDRPFIDPSLYALYAVSRNLDFSNQTLRHLAATGGFPLVTREEGLHELKRGTTR